MGRNICRLLVLILLLCSETELLTSLTVNSLELEESLTQNQINKLFTTFVCLGPAARTCLKLIKVTSDQSYNASLEIYLSRVDSEMNAFIAHGGRQTIENTVHQYASHRIAIMRPSKTGLSYTAQIITKRKDKSYLLKVSPGAKSGRAGTICPCGCFGGLERKRNGHVYGATERSRRIQTGPQRLFVFPLAVKGSVMSCVVGWIPWQDVVSPVVRYVLNHQGACFYGVVTWRIPVI